MNVELIIVGGASDWRTRRDIELEAIPRVGDLLWIDVGEMPSMKKFYVETVEWFERPDICHAALYISYPAP